MHGEVRLQLSEDGADAERLEAQTGYLRAELLQLDVDDVTLMTYSCCISPATA